MDLNEGILLIFVWLFCCFVGLSALSNRNVKLRLDYFVWKENS